MTSKKMSKASYKALRETIGSQAEVARLLDVHMMTISKRERGTLEITREAELALRYLAATERAARR